MFAQFFKLIFRLIVYIIIFFLLVWIVLGIHPNDAYVRAKTNLGQIFGRMGTYAQNMKKTAGDMKQVGETQLNEANARFHGRDLGLERVDAQLKESLGQGQAQTKEGLK